MAAKSFSAKEKKQITKEWNEIFPEMGIYKNMWLLKIVGPMAIGILLEIGSNKDYYTPTMHIHDLSDESETISLIGALDANFDYVSTKSKADKYLRVAEKLEKKSYIPLNQKLSFLELQKYLLKYLEDKTTDITDIRYILRIFVHLAIWYGDDNIIQESILLARKHLDYINQKYGNSHLISEYITDKDTLVKNVEKNIVKLKLEKIPRR